MQGFASGSLEADAAAVRLFADAGLEMLLAQSYAKNMGVLSLPPLHASHPQILYYNVDGSVLVALVTLLITLLPQK